MWPAVPWSPVVSTVIAVTPGSPSTESWHIRRRKGPKTYQPIDNLGHRSDLPFTDKDQWKGRKLTFCAYVCINSHNMFSLILLITILAGRKETQGK